MSKLRRYHQDGNFYFVTNVTFARKRILVEHADLLAQASAKLKQRLPFEIVADVVLPDHFHMLIDAGSANVSNLLQRIKQSFSMNYRKRSGMNGRVWQLRFWDHIIRDQDDLNTHIDYIHYNPVKHGLASHPFDYPHSSIHEYGLSGIYGPDRGAIAPQNFEDDYGE